MKKLTERLTRIFRKVEEELPTYEPLFPTETLQKLFTEELTNTGERK